MSYDLFIQAVDKPGTGFIQVGAVYFRYPNRIITIQY